ncbi:putative F-box/LRR-repeat protein [Raphanus sativus]|nr:putative F-box/LRR-repeat protein [Raphanus sativus]
MADSGERNRSQRKLKQETSSTGDSGDFISSMPDEILHHIISFNPTKLAVKTSVLSKRWRHVWCETPCLSFGVEATVRGINQTLISYRALKLLSFFLANAYYVTSREINSWIEFAMSRSVHKLHVSFHNYTCPDFFFLSSSLEKLYVRSALIPRCTTVSWKSLRNLKLSSCNVESSDNILSGCPILETLELIYCLGLPQRLDLSKSLSLRRLEIKWSFKSSYPVEILAPHIHYLKLTMYEEPCTLVDVSSVTEASLEICISYNFFSVADFVQIMVLKMLEKLQNVERLTFGRTLLQFKAKYI